MEKRYAFLLKNWLRFGLVGVLTSFISSNLYAQNGPAIMWDKTIGGSDNDQLTSLQQTFDGGYILGGRSISGISGDKSQVGIGFNDYWVVKVDALGNKLWDKTFGGNGNDELFSLQQTSDGGYILGGYSRSGISGDKSEPSKGNEDFWIVRLDAAGIKLWDKTIGGNSSDILYSVKQVADGGFILGGNSSSGISGDKSEANNGLGNFWIVKLSANGNKLWDKTIGSIYVDQLGSLQSTSDGGYILGGSSSSGIGGDKSQANKGGEDYWVVKLDSAGNKLWDKTFGGNADDKLYSLQQTTDGGYILGGESKSGKSGDKSQASKGNSDYWVIKLDSLGNLLWDKTLGGSIADVLLSLKQTSDGSYLLGGRSSSAISVDKSQNPKGYSDYWFVKLDSAGSQLWDKTIGGNGYDELWSLQQTSDNGYILGGQSSSGISFDKSQANNGAGIYTSDYWIVKLGADITGVNKPFSNSQILISPNPSPGKFNLQLNNISTAKVEVSVTDLLGRIILQKELQVANKLVSEELEIKATNGLYLLQIKAGNQITSRKLVIE